MPFRNPDTRLVLVLDGLDAHTEQLLMFEALMHLIILVRKLPWLYVFATSRLEPKMIQAFASPAATGHVHWQEFGDPSRSSNNAGLYLQSTLPRIHGYANLVKSDTSLLPRLISRAGDSLIFARIAVKFLDTQRNNAEKALKIILSEEEPAQSPLDSLYLQILQYTFPPNQLAALPQQHARLVSLLIIVALAGRPLPPATIAHLSLPLRKNIALHNTELDSADVDEVAQDPSETYKVIEMVSLLQPVLSFDNRGNVIPVHASLVQFLLDRSRCGNSLYHVNKDEGNTSFAHACLDAISSVETATGILIAHRTQEQALRIYGHYALLRLDGHLMDATWTDWLGSLLAAIVGGIQLPIMARIIITDSNPGTIIGWQYEGLKSFHQKNDLAANIGDDSERSAKAPIAEEYVKFMAYCCCVMDYIREHPEDDWPKFTGETVQIFFVEFLRQQGEEALADAASKWSADQLHVDRYWGVLSVLKAEIDQSDRARSIWYDFSVRGGNFFV
ncbi:hypothetical protein PsYK624_131430 [Phanerochaete sordida]|uniref:NACHT domain-containing protein n=1 Tax=Phanerochaete sordida TaxID=48140 RepID=A0A9P3GP49_9APHY|nr:hypothetical protein PsYK624_131430 [Phanerochaete sordida]